MKQKEDKWRLRFFCVMFRLCRYISVHLYILGLIRFSLAGFNSILSSYWYIVVVVVVLLQESTNYSVFVAFMALVQGVRY